MLSSSQIERFKRDGALVLRGFFTAKETSLWADEVYGHYGRPRDGEGWRTAVTSIRSSGFRLSTEPTPGGHGPMAGVFRSLHSDLDWQGENQLLIRPPRPDIPWTGGVPHLDFPVASPLRTLANVTIYLAQVRTGGGAFLYWPGSHHVAWRHFRQYPEDYMIRGARSQDQTFEIITAQAGVEPTEFTGRPGDLLLWHSLLLHAASTNHNTTPRIALIGRWGEALAPGELHYDFDRDPWDYWKFAANDGPAGRAARPEAARRGCAPGRAAL